MGLATDYCVKFTAVDAVELGYKVHLVIDGCRGVNLTPGDVDKAVAEMKKKRINVVTSEEALKLLTA
jgi:nicotinamidase/pyrazinamidase